MLIAPAACLFANFFSASSTTSAWADFRIDCLRRRWMRTSAGWKRLVILSGDERRQRRWSTGGDGTDQWKVIRLQWLYMLILSFPLSHPNTQKNTGVISKAPSKMKKMGGCIDCNCCCVIFVNQQTPCGCWRGPKILLDKSSSRIDEHRVASFDGKRV